jgi:hypothetical protein
LLCNSIQRKVSHNRLMKFFYFEILTLEQPHSTSNSRWLQHNLAALQQRPQVPLGVRRARNPASKAERRSCP